jgi:hypothetical protein
MRFCDASIECETGKIASKKSRVIPWKIALKCLIYKQVVPFEAKEFCAKDHDSQSPAQ